MANQDPIRPLKICHTCRHWVYKYKGLCERLGQGVGKFWYCAEWTGKPPDHSRTGTGNS